MSYIPAKAKIHTRVLTYIASNVWRDTHCHSRDSSNRRRELLHDPGKLARLLSTPIYVCVCVCGPKSYGRFDF